MTVSYSFTLWNVYSFWTGRIYLEWNSLLRVPKMFWMIFPSCIASLMA